MKTNSFKNKIIINLSNKIKKHLYVPTIFTYVKLLIILNILQYDTLNHHEL